MRDWSARIIPTAEEAGRRCVAAIAAALLLAPAALFAPPASAQKNAIWSATLTVGETTDHTPPRHGYRYTYGVGSLTSGTISHMGSQGRWEDIVLRRNGRFELSAVRTSGSKVSGSFKVCVDGTEFSFNPLGGDNLNEVEHTQFPYTSLSWSTGQKVKMALIAATDSCTNRAPAFGAASYVFILAENADGGTTPVSVGTVSATDADSGDTVTYSIQAGNTDDKLAIDSSTGAITYVGSGEDFEGFTNPADAFNLTVRASDWTDHTDVTVTV